MNYFSKIKVFLKGGRRLNERFGMKINCSKGLRKTWNLVFICRQRLEEKSIEKNTQ